MATKTSLLNETRELETDVAELVCALCGEEIQNGVFVQGNGPSEPLKQQFRDALNALIDERVKAALDRDPGVLRARGQWSQ